MGWRLGQRASKSACLVNPPLFRGDLGTNLIKQGENVKVRPSGSVTLLAKCSHGKRESLGLGPGRATSFSSPMSPIGTRTKGLSLTVRALCQLSYRAIWSVFDKYTETVSTDEYLIVVNKHRSSS